ncbi:MULTISPECIES: precorrin-3B synthase [Gammaproteobacteria]|uniref:Precorrin-3B synthase n=1 Tax=Pseudomonas lini TaxID=163011 RepID=A0A423J4M3_9PSED|nr:MULTISPECIES: precorrin-3B synthase [Gammaproteobacteria]MBK5304696.1 precorrin-3B synthase [Bacillus sp. TH86]MBK5324465.1 precorrin-3B synthase [Bacillus sp. TH59]MBK5339415.1 precorrin-3B synthase [Bacillus sp. TH57]MBK5318961.1 precorrin-3B synthase [Erwinia sp. TH79]MBK5423821.1 precorrin-3B synthase [Erwinia sp. TH29]
MSTALRPSACPGLLRIVPALDGGICRIKLNGGSISAAQAEAVASAAERFAGGVIEATNRANLQIRGIGGEQTALIDSLLAAGLGPRTAAGDDVRNLMLSPSAGIDRQMLLDTRPLAEQILTSLQSHERFHQLSAKFAVQLDGGESLAMLEHPHDLWLSAVEHEGECVLAFGLAGCPTQTPSGAVRLENGHALVIAVLELFLDLARPDQTRMRHLLAEYPVAGFVAQVAERVPLLSIVSGARVTNSNVLHIGVHPQRETGRVYVGATPPLGRLDPAMLRGAARLARERGDGSLRFTPWQSLLLPDIHEDDAAQVIHSLESLRLRCSADDALAHLIACTGSAGCGKGLSDTKGDALQLATLLQRQGQVFDVHLSGCARSCAAAHITPATLLAVSPGHYDLYFRDAAQPGFGALHARNLTIEAVATLLDARSRSSLDA